MYICRVLKLHEVILSVLIILLIFFNSCNTDNEDFTLGSNFVEKSTKIIQVDTFSLELSTVIVDSLITSATGVILAGYHENGIFGKITANSFFRIGLPDQTFYYINDDDIYDSLTLEMPYSKYCYGDTNAIQEIEIYKLQERLVRTEIPDYYNNSSINIYDYPIGELAYYPRPNRDSTVEIRIDDLLGKDLFDKMKHNAEEVSSNSDFEEYIYGFAIIAKQIQSSSIIGFDCSDLKFNLYTSNIDVEKDAVIYEFPSSYLGYQFNQIICDRSGTILENLNSQKDQLDSYSADDKSFVQAGLGVLTKIKFPYLNNALFDESKLILSVELILKPDIESYESGFPESLFLYETDKYHEFDINKDENYISSSVFNLDEMYHEETYYSFDITNFLQVQIDDNYIDNERCLLVTVPLAEYNTSLESFIVSADKDVNKKPILNITYLEI